MKNKILAVITLLISLWSSTGCEDNRQEFLSDYSTVLFFLNSGEQNVTFYKTGVDVDYKLTVNKGGWNENAVTHVDVSVIDEVAMEAYNAENGTKYKALPANCYLLKTASTVSFASNESYHFFELTFKPDVISALPDYGLGNYVLPLQLCNSKDVINKDREAVFIKPAVIIPSVSFDKTGYVSTVVTESGVADVNLTLPISLSLDNQWAFDCSVGVDEALLDDYNAENGKNYTLLPSSYYTITDKVSFAPGESKREIKITVKRSALTYGQYVLPLRLISTSVPFVVIDPDKSQCLFGIDYTLDKSDLTKIELTESMLSTNAPNLDEGPIKNLIDGDLTTFFHSDWKNDDATEDDYIQLELPASSYKAMYFNFVGRADGSLGNPAQINVAVSQDGLAFTDIKVLNEDLPKDSEERGSRYESPVIISATPFKYVRLSVPLNLQGKKYVVFSELSIYGLAK